MGGDRGIAALGTWLWFKFERLSERMLRMGMKAVGRTMVVEKGMMGVARGMGGRVTQEMGVEEALQNAAALGETTWTEKEKMALCARILAEEGHGTTLSGQITCRDTYNGNLAIWTQVYGQALEEVTPASFVLLDEELQVVEGEGKPNLATRFHLHVYKVRPDIQCMVHTHPPQASALAMVGVPLHVGHMDTMALYKDVGYLPRWPGIPFGDEEGEIIAGVIGEDKMGAFLAHHGILAAGKSIEEATYRAFFMERAAKMQLTAMAAAGVTHPDQLPQVDEELAQHAHDWRSSDPATKAHFNSWARQAIDAGLPRGIFTSEPRTS